MVLFLKKKMKKVKLFLLLTICILSNVMSYEKCTFLLSMWKENHNTIHIWN